MQFLLVKKTHFTRCAWHCHGIESEELKLGDVPYVYSIIPLSQTANTPIFELSYATGVRGNQTSSVENYKKYLNTLAENFVKNIGE